MRQFPYAQRTPIHHPQQAGRGDDAQQQSPSSPPPQRDTMTDVQEQISKIAESTFASPVHRDPVVPATRLPASLTVIPLPPCS
jgi:hypothetical protein